MLKTTFENDHINFSNSDFSIDNASICAKFLEYVPQSSDFDPGKIFMLILSFNLVVCLYPWRNG